MRLAALILVAIVCAGLPAARSAGADDACAQEVVVYVDAASDLDAVRARCNAELSAAAPTTERAITSEDGTPRGRLLVYRLAGWSERDARRQSRRLAGASGVKDSFVNGRCRVRGAPTQIPVLEGDLEPRSILDQPAMDQVSMAAARTRGTGAGVVVAVLDGGFDLRHEALAGRLTTDRADTLDGDLDPQDLGNGTDDDGDEVADNLAGHGTFVASLVLAAAPDARVMPVRVLDDEGWGTPVSLAMGIQYAMDRGADVLNLSLTVESATPVVRDAVRAALDAGMVIVTSAGNGPGWQQDPLIANRAITVGAVDGSDAAADFTSTSCHVFAPGVGILGARGVSSANEYAEWQGTSFSAALTSGAAAILHGIAPAITSADARSVLRDTAAEIEVDGRTRLRLDAGAAAAAAAAR